MAAGRKKRGKSKRYVDEERRKIKRRSTKNTRKVTQNFGAGFYVLEHFDTSSYLHTSQCIYWWALWFVSSGGVRFELSYHSLKLNSALVDNYTHLNNIYRW